MQETQEMRVQSLGWEAPLEEGMATHSSILVWEIPWTEEPGRHQSMESQRVGHSLATKQQQKGSFKRVKASRILFLAKTCDYLAATLFSAGL